MAQGYRLGSKQTTNDPLLHEVEFGIFVALLFLFCFCLFVFQVTIIG